MSVRIGVSGWSYPRWRGDFYPERLRQRAELRYVAERMPAVEVNASFYRLQRPSTYVAWAAEVPHGFRFAIKGSRYITHLRALRDARVPLANLLASGPLALGERLGPMLWQLPASHAFERDRLEDFLVLLPRTTGEAAALAAEHDERVPEDRAWTMSAVDVPLRHVLEPRHPSFGAPQCAALLRSYGIGMVVADSAGTFPELDVVTTDLVYVRLHGHEHLYRGGYDEALLKRWAARIRRWHDATGDVWVFFDNDADGRAPYDAVRLLGLLEDLGPVEPPIGRPAPGRTAAGA